jgi:cysteinyl-tRNA synthetase
VAGYPDYGQLSGARLEDMVAQEPSDLKEDQRDFALWKATKPHEDISWPSPWGAGRPGWHIECSAMADKLLGPVFEIHGGGMDLRFPHHENELAQSRGAGREFARLWAHNGMLELAREKMAKSVGNVVSLREALDTYGREAILLLFLGAHYRSPVEYSDEALEAARTQAEEFRTAFRVVEKTGGAPGWDEFEAALDDDFNTPLALSILHAWRSAGELELLERGLGIFGLEVESAGEAPAAVVFLAEERQAARAAGDFGRADELRAEIETQGWEVQDVSGGFRLIPRA